MRKSLLPDFLLNETWISLLDAVDTVFKTEVDDPAEGLSKIRQTTILSEDALERLDSGLMIDESHLRSFDKVTNVLSGNLLGFGLQNSDMVTAAQYSRLLRNLSSLWYSKGTQNLDDFISYAFNSQVLIETMWTKDYQTFLPEGDPGIGFSLFQGGEWYPTSHIQVSYDPTVLTSVSVENLLTLVYELGAYTLVVEKVSTDSTIPIVNAIEPDPVYPNFPGTESVALGLSLIIDMEIDSDPPV